MFSLKKTRKAYQVPRAAVSEVYLEGVICHSVILNIAVKDLENMNDSKSVHYDDTESFYFES